MEFCSSYYHVRAILIFPAPTLARARTPLRVIAGIESFSPFRIGDCGVESEVETLEANATVGLGRFPRSTTEARSGFEEGASEWVVPAPELAAIRLFLNRTWIPSSGRHCTFTFYDSLLNEVSRMHNRPSS